MNVRGKLKVRIFNFEPMDPARTIEIHEDANVLNHLIRMPSTTLNENVLGVSVPQAASQNTAIYIQGTGLIFAYHVGFPVAQTDEEAAESDESGEPKSSWDRAREAVRTADQGGFGLVVNRQPDSPAIKYDADRVDALDQIVASALREAGNFRNLESGNSITVYVYGPVMLSESGATRSVIAYKVQLVTGAHGKLYPQDLKRSQFVEEASNDVSQFSFYQGVLSD